MNILLKKYGVLVALALVMMISAWMASDKCCVPGYAEGVIHKNMIIVALELTPTYEGWERYLTDTTCLIDTTAEREAIDANISCLQTQIKKDLAFIASYTLLFILCVRIIFSAKWQHISGCILAGSIAAFDLLENLYLHLILKGFENPIPDVEKISHHTVCMFDVSLSKWALLIFLILGLFHTTWRDHGLWHKAGMLILTVSLFIFLWTPVWDWDATFPVPGVVLGINLVSLVLIFIRLFTSENKS